MPVKKEIRCERCNKLFFKAAKISPENEIEVECSRCGHVNEPKNK